MQSIYLLLLQVLMTMTVWLMALYVDGETKPGLMMLAWRRRFNSHNLFRHYEAFGAFQSHCSRSVWRT